MEKVFLEVLTKNVTCCASLTLPEGRASKWSLQVEPSSCAHRLNFRSEVLNNISVIF